ncbi:MAG: YhcH/YjgK/YiaL family protein [Anaerohalosphaeraceae bacterium]
MIIDTLDHAFLYKNIEPQIAAGLALLEEDYVRTAAEGRYEVQGEDLFFIVQEYATAPFEQGRLEIHQKYLDIQFIASGRECIGYAPLEGLAELESYSDSKDIAFYSSNRPVSRLVLETGMFAVFFPQEPHMPGRQVSDKPEPVKKIVIKIRME